MESTSARSTKMAIAEKELTLTTGLTVVLLKQPRAAALQHVVHALDDFVDVSCQWSIAHACALHDRSGGDGGACRLVARVVARRPLAAMDIFHRRAQLSAGLVSAAEHGHMELVRWLVDNIVCERFIIDHHSCIVKAIEAAAANGHMRILDNLLSYDKHAVSVKAAMLCAARGGRLDVLQWLSGRLGDLEELSSVANPLLEIAADKGYNNMADWLIETVGADCLHQSAFRATQYAICGGHLQMAQRLTNVEPFIDEFPCLDEAAGSGHLQTVQWGHEHRGVCTSHAMDTAASNGHFDVVQWLHHHRTEGCTTQAMNNAASHGHLNIVQWLHKNRVEGCTTEAMDGAARHGHLNVVKWLNYHRNEGCTVAAMDGAARENHLDVIEWLHDHRTEGCTQAALDDAASRGNLSVLRWLIAHRPDDCHYSPYALKNSAANGHLRTVQWLYENHPKSNVAKFDRIASTAMDLAASGGHLKVVQWLHNHRPQLGGCSTAAMDGAAANGHLHIVKWLHVNRREGCTYRAMDGAAAGGNLEILLFLHSQRSEGCTSDAAVKAALNDHVEVVQWLLQHYPQQIVHERVREFAARYNFTLLDQFRRICIFPVAAY